MSILAKLKNQEPLSQPEGAMLLIMKGRLKLEAKGLKFRGGSATALVKRELGLKGNNQSVTEQFEKLVKTALGV